MKNFLLKTQDEARKFLVSDRYSFVLFLGACVALFSGREVFFVCLFIVFIFVVFFLTDDLLPVLEAALVTTCFAIRCKHSFNEFIKYWYWAVPVLILFTIHLVRYKIKPQKTIILPGMLATSFAIVLGGVGVIYWKTYFSPTSLFYMFALGFGMAFVVSYAAGSLRGDRGYDFPERFSKMMVNLIFVLTVALFEEYFSRSAEFMEEMGIIPFQWRNNGASLLMLAMPFAFYLARKNYAWTFAGLLALAGILFTGSRGGLIFGTVEFLLCFFSMLFIDKKHRKHNIITLLVGICIWAFASQYLLHIIGNTIERLLDLDESSIRLKLIERGINDFKTSPVVGRGLAYMGNRDVHASAKHTLCWYHCSLVQVPASFGIVGIVAYGFLNYLRIKTFVKYKTFFNFILLLAFVGIEMMSLVNPGVFAPFPYLLLTNIFFVVMEKCSSENDEKISDLRRG